MNELVKAPKQEITLTPQQMLSTLVQQGSDPAVLKEFMDLAERWDDREAKKSYNRSMVKAQKNMPIVPEDRRNTQTNSNYSSYKIVLKYTKPIYTKEGFCLSFYEGETPKENHIRVMADIMHDKGHSKTRHVDIPLDNAGIKGNVNKTPTHAKGSSLSYGKGYLIKLIFNIPTGDDDDGNAASGKPVEFLSKDQANKIHAMITDNGLDMTAFLKYKKIKSIEAIPASAFKQTIESIKAVIAKRASK